MPFPTYNPMREYWNHSELVNLWFTHSYQLDNNVFEALSNPNNIGKWFTMTQYETRLCGLRGYFTVNAMLLSISTEHPFEADKILGGEDRSNWVYTLKPIEITRPDDCPMERPFMVFYMKYEFSNFS
jgi:hypothetical protein